ncbi:MAG: DJ-1/PfpI family protein [Candidatus Peregrinibacteria bacterium]
MPKILSIIAPNGYQDKEYEDSKKALEKKGHKVITTSAKQTANGKLGGTTQVDILLNDVNPEDYDAVLFVGGPGCYEYQTNQKALSLAKDFFSANKITAAICAAPSILAKAGILEGRTITSHPCEKDYLSSLPLTYTGKSVQVDLPIITADGPDSAKKFGKAIAKALKYSPTPPSPSSKSPATKSASAKTGPATPRAALS